MAAITHAIFSRLMQHAERCQKHGRNIACNFLATPAKCRALFKARLQYCTRFFQDACKTPSDVHRTVAISHAIFFNAYNVGSYAQRTVAISHAIFLRRQQLGKQCSETSRDITCNFPAIADPIILLHNGYGMQS